MPDSNPFPKLGISAPQLQDPYKALMSKFDWRTWSPTELSKDQPDNAKVVKLAKQWQKAYQKVLSMIDADVNYDKTAADKYSSDFLWSLAMIDGTQPNPGTANDAYISAGNDLQMLMDALPKPSDLTAKKGLEDAFHSFNDLTFSIGMDVVTTVENTYRNATGKTETRAETQAQVNLAMQAETAHTLVGDPPDELLIHPDEDVSDYLSIVENSKTKLRNLGKARIHIPRIDILLNPDPSKPPPSKHANLAKEMGAVANEFSKLNARIMMTSSKYPTKKDAVEAAQEAMLLLEGLRGALGDRRGTGPDLHSIDMALENKWQGMASTIVDDIQDGERTMREEEAAVPA